MNYYDVHLLYNVLYMKSSMVFCLKTLFQNDMLNETYYFLPYVCWLEAVTNQEISKKSRIDLLHIAYDIFYSFLVQNVNEKRGPHITINNSENSEAKVFADNNLLIRSMNSILGMFKSNGFSNKSDLNDFLDKSYPTENLLKIALQFTSDYLSLFYLYFIYLHFIYIHL